MKALKFPLVWEDRLGNCWTASAQEHWGNLCNQLNIAIGDA